MQPEKERRQSQQKLKFAVLLFSSRSKTLMTPDLEPAPIQFSELLNATLCTGDVIPDILCGVSGRRGREKVGDSGRE